MDDTIEFMGYTIGTGECLDGDLEQITFSPFKPAGGIPNFPAAATCLNINTINGWVIAHDDNGKELATWQWPDFIANIPFKR